MTVSLLSDHAADVFGELDLYVVRCGVAIDPRALVALDELRTIFRDGEKELLGLIEMLEDALGAEWRVTSRED